MQRQRFPSRACSISSRVGSGVLVLGSASAFITIPGEQYPHWEAPAATKHSLQRSRSSSERPSWVVTCFPSNRRAFCAQETTARPSTITVHAPQEPSGAQPSLTDRTPISSRRSSSRLVSSPGSADTAFPLSVNSTAAASLPALFHRAEHE